VYLGDVLDFGFFHLIQAYLFPFSFSSRER
jgi:hypothetical protein